ncbi:hypothetical protein FBR05_03175 [Deltaproteobacteria bacterium PRO3]|nr:hypothetical protein [Deltaproteobacteria bacterium PRO3]
MLNKNANPQIIRLRELFEKNISTRQALSKIKEQFAPSATKIILDFSDIDFVSRSFSHELIRFSKSWEKQIEFKNLNPTIQALFSKVQAAKPTSRSASAPIKITSFEESATIF